PALVRTSTVFLSSSLFSYFFCHDTATTAPYTLSLHDALPISVRTPPWRSSRPTSPTSRRSSTTSRTSPTWTRTPTGSMRSPPGRDRKSTRLNSSHVKISYAVFCLKKKKNIDKTFKDQVNLKRQ